MDDKVLVIVSRPVLTNEKSPKAPGHAITVDADAQGRVLFRETEAVPADPAVLEETFQHCLSTAGRMFSKTKAAMGSFEVEEIKIKLGLDAKGGFGFLGGAELNAALEVTLKRK